MRKEKTSSKTPLSKPVLVSKRQFQDSEIKDRRQRSWLRCSGRVLSVSRISFTGPCVFHSERGRKARLDWGDRLGEKEVRRGSTERWEEERDEATEEKKKDERGAVGEVVHRFFFLEREREASSCSFFSCICCRSCLFEALAAAAQERFLQDRLDKFLWLLKQ